MFPKFAPALLNLAIIILIALKSLTLDVGSLEQFALLLVGAVVTFIAPLLPGAKWQGRLKTGAAILTAVLVALVPFASQGWHLSKDQIITVALAALAALAVELGVQIRAGVHAGVTLNTTVPKIGASGLLITSGGSITVPTPLASTGSITSSTALGSAGAITAPEVVPPVV